MKITFIHDAFRRKRGKWSRMLRISCKSCRKFLFYYQKDGSGPLKRSYIDRIVATGKNIYGDQKWVHCPQCGVILGFSEPYRKENSRPAIRWAVDAIFYTIVPLSMINQKTERHFSGNSLRNSRLLV